MGKYVLEELVLQDKLSPMMKQYILLKLENMDKLIFYRLGDFYEMFFDDAITASRELELTLTGRDCGLPERAPMCGIPHHAVSGYLNRLIEKGYKVAICEQVEDPKTAKGIVRREIVRVVTPGTVTDETTLSDERNNFICSIYGDNVAVGLVFADVSTGELNIVKPVADKDYVFKILSELSKYSPKEILISSKIGGNKKLIEEINIKFSPLINYIDETAYNFEDSVKMINERFSKEDIEKNDLFSSVQSVYALYILMDYLENTQLNEMKHVNSFEYYEEKDFAYIDISTKRNLELTETLREKKKIGSLLGVLDKTKTSMGARLMRHYIEMPLKSPTQILNRLSAVEELYSKTAEREELIELLDKIYDIERLSTKVSYRNANGRDLIALKKSLENVPDIKKVLGKFSSPLLKDIDRQLDSMEDTVELLERALYEVQPINITEGEIIKDGYDETLDELRRAGKEGKNWIFQIEAQEREKTNIKNLKIGYNKVFGYYIEVTKSYLSLVPDYFVRKQTLANCERYITDKLKEVENLVIGAEEKSINLEYKLFTDIREKLFDKLEILQKIAKGVAALDVLCSFAYVAYKNHYVKPLISNDGKIIIKDGRHPVVEQMVKNGAFIPNDTYLNLTDNSFAIITGPNMAGKSTYMRQVALTSIMMQIGSFVPASSATLPIVDKVFTRVGASDDLASGQSTFMVEMSEVANILKNATKESLIILDEIGRGTSTFDGLSIAWSVVEYILRKIGAKTLFATHYHELTVLEDKLKGVKNYQIAVKKRGDDITFLRKIIEGGTDDSYGIEVSKLAGVPDEVIKRAKEIVKVLESRSIAVDEIDLKSVPAPEREDENQLGFASMVDDNIIKTLKAIEVTTLTPIEALNILNDLCKEAKGLQ